MAPNPQQVLAAPLTHTDLPHVATVGDYLRHLLQTLWKETYRFDGKRPFGNSGWENDLYMALVHAGLVEGSFDEDGFLDSVDDKAAHNLIKGAINYVFA